jgi:hypothetical protein
MAILGAIRGGGQNYVDGLEHLSVLVVNTEAQGLPFAEKQRIPITLNISGNKYQAGIRSRPNYRYVWISPDLIDAEGEKTDLSHVFSKTGFEKNQKVELKVSGKSVTLKAIA